MSKPVLYCFVAKPYDGAGRVDGIVIVPLVDVPEKIAAGWLMVGPDPHDEAELATWERLQLPINRPRWWQGDPNR